MQSAQENVTLAQSLRPLLKATAVGLGTLGGFALGGMMGSLILADLPAGLGAIIGAFAAGFVALIISCCVTSMWSDFLPDMSLEAMQHSLSKKVPNALAPLVADHAAFTLILTIHRVECVDVTNRWGTQPSLYVEIECGDNPIKRSCVSSSCDALGNAVFDEQFRVNITPQDSFFMIYLKDQAWFGSSLVAYVPVDIRNDILAPSDSSISPFPSKTKLTLQGGENCTIKFDEKTEAKIVCSFGHTSDMLYTPFDDGQTGNDTKPLNEASWQSDYGSVSYLSQVQYNQNTKVEFAAVQKMQPQPHFSNVDMRAGANMPNTGYASIWAQP